MTKRKIEKIKTSEEFYEHARLLLDGAHQEAIKAWLASPITKALIATMRGDLQGHYEDWGNGTFTDKDAYGTVQMNARALGEVRAIDGILDWIEELTDRKEDNI